MWKILSSMIVILSTIDPTVSATFAPLGRLPGAASARARFLRDLPAHFLVDALHEIVALLIQLVDVALGGGHLEVVRDARLILLVPQLDVGHGEAGNEIA